MFEQVRYPQSIKPSQLDQLLAMGWFRMGQSIFTTNYIMFNRQIFRTIWLRHVLKNYTESSTFQKLKKRNKALRIVICKAQIDEAHETLFELYKSSIEFEAASSLEQLLNGYVFVPAQIYNTYEVNLYDGDQLIGCSYFDIGHKSAEGISAYFDPAYKAQSPGRYMIYLQIEFCRAQGFDFYYPGYFVPGYPHLDYKLHIGTDCLEYLDVEDGCWYPIGEFKDEDLPGGFAYDDSSIEL
ncbi:MAG: GNAT family N-acetyltransferase [Chitinophagaceae bacterium]|nr:GNAT family N-acetyltransferase [Chitinophagaceae bacterium]